MTLNLSNPEPFAARTDLPCKPPIGADDKQKQAHADAWYPDREAVENRAAKVLCKDCPVILDCGIYALETEQEHGIWGGMSTRDRKAILNGKAPKERREVAAGPARKSCGNVHGYRAHIRNNEDPCAPCLDAEAARGVSRRAKKKAAA